MIETSPRDQSAAWDLRLQGQSIFGYFVDAELGRRSIWGNDPSGLAHWVYVQANASF